MQIWTANIWYPRGYPTMYSCIQCSQLKLHAQFPSSSYISILSGSIPHLICTERSLSFTVMIPEVCSTDLALHFYYVVGLPTDTKTVSQFGFLPHFFSPCVYGIWILPPPHFFFGYNSPQFHFLVINLYITPILYIFYLFISVSSKIPVKDFTSNPIESLHFLQRSTKHVCVCACESINKWTASTFFQTPESPL